MRAWIFVPSVYETLYQYTYLSETYKLEPLLAADKPKISADKLTLTIPIKHGVKFQDDPCFKETQGKGRELKAQDFVYEIKRLALPGIQSQGWWIADGKIIGINAFHDKLTKASKEELPKIFDEQVEGVRGPPVYRAGHGRGTLCGGGLDVGDAVVGDLGALQIAALARDCFAGSGGEICGDVGSDGDFAGGAGNRDADVDRRSGAGRSAISSGSVGSLDGTIIQMHG